MATLNSKIIICKGINIDKEYVNVLSYSESDMVSLCQSKAVASANDYQFIREHNSIYTNFTYNQCLQCNYIAFQNPDYSNKWFFAFITEVIYQGEENTEIKFKVDAWSTWYDYWTKKACYVIREHTNDDTIGANTINEDIDVGEVTEIGFTEFNALGEDFYFAVLSSVECKGNDSVRYSGVNQYNGMIYGKKIYLFDPDNLGVTTLSYYIDHANQMQAIEDIEAVFVLPKVLCQNTTTITDTFTPSGSSTQKSYDYERLNNSNSSYIENDFNVYAPTTYSDYTPKNNKCFCYPYNYLLVSNNIGTNIPYKYENFVKSNGDVLFDIEASVCIGGSVRAVPKNYKGSTKNYDECIPLAKYPTGAWTSDAYTNWLTGNSVNILKTLGIAGVAIAGSALAGPIVGAAAIISASSSLGGLLGQFIEAKLASPITGGSNDGDVNFSSGKNTFVFKNMRCKLEYLIKIDDYFSRYGYKTLRIKSPNLTGRQNWNYIEIAGDDDIGTGDVPVNYMDEINKACRKGVTIWHNHTNVGNYSLSNSIV